MKLEINHIVKTFGSKEVLRDISIKAESGKAHGLLGRNGAGKTTTMRIIMDIFPPDSGEILLDGKPLKHSEIQIGYLPEERGMYPKITILNQLIYLGCLRGMSSKDAKAAAIRNLERLGMAEYQSKKLQTLSKGNQQKIQLAATIMCNPKIVILDEPFSGLDPVNATLLKDVVKDMVKQGAIVLFSSHQMNYIEEFCDTISILNGGQIAVDGRISEIKRSYPRNRLKISSRDCAKIQPFLLEKFSSEIQTLTRAEDEDNALIVTLNNEKYKSSVFNSLSGFDIDVFEVCEPSLSDIFVQYTEDKI
ncbi:MAG: ABC transporter ATP-binding protein [Acutalibacteraceae bacterium]